MPVWIVTLAVLATAGGIAVLDEEAGVGTWLALRAESRQAQARIDRLAADVERLSGEIEALAADEIALERAIREDLELARPGEWVVRFATSPVPGLAESSPTTSRFH